MHFCAAKIMIGGDRDNIMSRDAFNPVSWPEIEVLRFIHGDDSVFDVEPFVEVEQSPRNERQRLAFIYGEGPCAGIWGGRSAPTHMDAPKVKVKAGVKWFNPLTRLAETTTKDGSEQVDPAALPSAPPMAQEPAGDDNTVGDPRAAPETGEDDPFAEDGATSDKSAKRRR